MVECGHCEEDIPKDSRYCPYCGERDPIPTGGCFIATCIYGENAFETNLLRLWRDTSLEPHVFGRAFIKTYYKISPHIVGFIKNKPRLKIITRKLLNLHVRRLKK